MSGSYSRDIHNRKVFADMRSFVENQFRARSLLRAAFILAPPVTGFALLLALMLVVPWWLMPIVGLLSGIIATILFVIAHDAAHNAFTPFAWLNAIIARGCFLPAWTSYTGWVHAHNHIHHGWTNLVPKDYVWAPMSKQQYQSLTPIQQWRVRFYRSSLGFAAYYFWEITVKRIFWLQPEVRKSSVRRMWLLDDLLVVLAMCLQAGCMGWLISKTQPGVSWIWMAVCSQVIPGLLTSYLIGFTTYLQHTHPLIPWFDDMEEWTFYIGQIRGTTHTHLPYRFNSLFQNIMEHTAHHIDTRIPLYNLPEVQADIEKAYPGEIVQHRFSFRSLKRIVTTCQLYDFREHCWLSYAGHPTSSRTITFALSSTETK